MVAHVVFNQLENPMKKLFALLAGLLLGGCASLAPVPSTTTADAITVAPLTGVEQIMSIAERCPGNVAITAGATETAYKAVVKCQWASPVRTPVW